MTLAAGIRADLATISDCARGCILHNNRHQPGCYCTRKCSDYQDHDHCYGCQPDVGHYCQKCADQFRDSLRSIPQLVTQVAQQPRLITKQSTGDTSRRSTKVDQQSPSPAWDLADEIIQWAQAWAWVVAGRPGYDPVRVDNAGIPVREISACITHISNRLTQALTESYHMDIWDETTEYARRLELVTGLDRLTHRLKEPCPSCGLRTLTREDGADHVRCANRTCGRTWTEGEYDNLAHVAASC